MAFFRFSRDKRGYENFYLVEPVSNRRGKSSRPRVLYWYRTPPGVKVGREPFDAEVRRALEAQNPTVTFDWPAIVSAPIPSAETEKWRERRRAEKAERAARRSGGGEVPDDARGPEAEDPSDTEDSGPAAGAAASESTDEVAAAVPATVAAAAPTPQRGDAGSRKRRRRRRGRPQRAEGDAGAATMAAPAPDDGAAPAGPPDAGEPSGD